MAERARQRMALAHGQNVPDLEQVAIFQVRTVGRIMTGAASDEIDLARHQLLDHHFGVAFDEADLHIGLPAVKAADGGGDMPPGHRFADADGDAAATRIAQQLDFPHHPLGQGLTRREWNFVFYSHCSPGPTGGFHMRHPEFRRAGHQP